MNIKKFERIVIIIFVCMCVLFCYLAYPRHSSTTSLDDYLKTNVPLSYSDFDIFPDIKNIEKNDVKLYQSETFSAIVFDDIYFLLNCTYNKDHYENELVRLQETGAEYREDIFLYPSYVMLCYGKYYEYALLDSQTYSIVYVYADATNFAYFENFPKEYQPLDTENVDICHYRYD